MVKLLADLIGLCERLSSGFLAATYLLFRSTPHQLPPTGACKACLRGEGHARKSLRAFSKARVEERSGVAHGPCVAKTTGVPNAMAPLRDGTSHAS